MLAKENDYNFRMQYGSQVPGGQESITAMLYDTQTYTSGTTTRLDFFGTVQTNKVLGNMKVGGQLPSPWSFLIQAVRVVPIILPAEEVLTAVGAFAANATIDIHRLIYLSRVTLTVGDKEYLNHPTSVFTSGQGITAEIAESEASGATTVYEAHRISMANNGVADPRAVYTLPYFRYLEPQITWTFSIHWNSAVTLSGDQNIRVELDGVQYRPIQ